jgi:hypothetical protein
MVQIPMALFNFERGGRRGPGAYAWDKLARGFSGVGEAPVLIGLCEAKEYGFWGGRALFTAAQVLAGTLGRCYEPRLGHSPRGGEATRPALFYDSQVLALTFWGDEHCTVEDDQRNLARFQVRATGAQFWVKIEHWRYDSGDVRLEHGAKPVARYGRDPIGGILLGDLNGTASGPHLPGRHWDEADFPGRTHKGRADADGVWGPDTRAVDHLIGRWDHGAGGRVEGAGFHAIAELAHQLGTAAEVAFRATVNDGIDPGGGQLVDWALANDALRERIVKDSYHVDIPTATTRDDLSSDHRCVTWAVNL